MTGRRPNDVAVPEADRSPADDGAPAGTEVIGAGVIGAALVAISPFDLARPLDGWTGLHLRPLLLITAALAAVLLTRRRDPIDRPLLAATAALVLGFAIAASVSVDPSTGFAVAVRVAVLGLVFVASAGALGGRPERRWLIIGVGVGAVAAAIVGLVVHASGTDRFGTDLLLGSISVTRGVTRLTRPFSHANVAAMYLAPATVMLVGAAVKPVSWLPAGPGAAGGGRGSAAFGVRRGRALGLAAAGAASLAALSLSLTLSRGGILALLVGLAVLVIAGVRGRSGQRRSTIGAPLAIATLAVGAGLVSGGWGPRLGASTSAGAAAEAVGAAEVSAGLAPVAPAAPSRPTIWGQAIDAWLDHPVTGVGPGRFGPYTRSLTADGDAAVAHAHNPILEALATGGLVATLGVVVFAVTVIRRAWPGRSVVPVGLSAALVAAMLPMVVDHPFAFSSSGNLAAVLGGTWYGAARSWHS